MKQTTLKSEVHCAGIGLHGGQRVRLVAKPAKANTGIVLTAVQKNRRRHLQIVPENVVATGLATTIGDGEFAVSTVEHLLAALVGLEIDNVVIEIFGSEVPILDGSSSAFVHLFHSAGIVFLESPRQILRIKKEVRFVAENKSIVAAPYNGLKINYRIAFPHRSIGTQQFSYISTPENFVSLLSRARTFGFLKDVELLQKNGLALGGSLDNAVVFDDYGVLNPDGLRFSDELVRHKILDFMGDMGVSPRRLQGEFTVDCSGHEFNNKFLRFVHENMAEYVEPVCAYPHRQPATNPDPVLAGGVPAWA